MLVRTKTTGPLALVAVEVCKSKEGDFSYFTRVAYNFTMAKMIISYLHQLSTTDLRCMVVLGETYGQLAPFHGDYTLVRTYKFEFSLDDAVYEHTSI